MPIGPRSSPATATRARDAPLFFALKVSDRSHTDRKEQEPMTPAKPRAGWTLALVSVALFMATLDNLVVSTALPSIRADLGAIDRVPAVDGQRLHARLRRAAAHRRRARRPLRPPPDVHDRRRRLHRRQRWPPRCRRRPARWSPPAPLQGLGAALVLPLTLTLLSEAVPPERRGAALGIWAGVSGLGVALGPLVGGAVVEGISWHWIFWINVPVGLALIPLARAAADGVLRARPAPGPAGARAGRPRPARRRLRDRPRRGARVDVGDRDDLDRRGPRPARRLRRLGAPRAGADAAAAVLPLARASAPPTASRSRCTSASSARSSCSRSTSRPRRATRRCRPACGRCPGRACR